MDSIRRVRAELSRESVLLWRAEHLPPIRTFLIWQVLLAERTLAIFQNAYEYTTLLVPALVIAPRYFAGEVEFGVVSQAVIGFRAVRDATAMIVDRYADLARYSAVVGRLHAMESICEMCGADDGPTPPPVGASDAIGGAAEAKAVDGVAPEEAALPAALEGDGGVHELAATDAEVLRMDSVAIRPPQPGAPLLVAAITLALRRGHKMLIVGPSGVGKSSVLRVLCGLWRAEAGSVARSPRCFFVPQRSYMLLGTLREQLGYPSQSDALAPAAAEAALEQVGLGKLSSWLHGKRALEAPDWAQMLSLGEQQRLAIARLLLHRPLLALLDEATSALDAMNERRVYTLVSEAVDSFVSVGHRPALLSFHTHVLELAGGGAAGRLLTREEYEAGLRTRE